MGTKKAGLKGYSLRKNNPERRKGNAGTRQKGTASEVKTAR